MTVWLGPCSRHEKGAPGRPTSRVCMYAMLNKAVICNCNPIYWWEFRKKKREKEKGDVIGKADWLDASSGQRFTTTTGGRAYSAGKT